MDPVKAWLERTPQRRFVALGAAGVLVPLAATAIATGAGDPILVLLAGLVGAGWSWGAWHRHQVASLPLEIGPVALRGMVDGVAQFRFRARLGRGRLIRDAEIALRFRGEDGTEVSLTPVVPARATVGPLTITASDPDGRCAGPGTLTLSLTVREGDQTWQAQHTWDSHTIDEGRFEPGFRTVRGRLRWDHDSWASARPPQ